MISFKEFLLEDDISDWKTNAKAIVDIIKRDCKPFLDVYNGKILYRGTYVASDGYFTPMAGTKKALYVGTVRQNRKPKDSPQWLHDLMNKKFVEDFGTPLRSNSLFVIGDHDQAENYGNVYAIFPIGEFNYAWSDKIADPTSNLYLDPLENGYIDGFGSPAYAKTVEKEFFRFLKEKHPEVYKETGSSYAIFYSWFTDNRIHQNRVDDSIWVNFVKEFLDKKNLWKFNTGLNTALGSKYNKHEIMLQCQKYYAVSTDVISSSALLKLLK